MLKRIFDIVFSIFGIVFFLPVFLIIGVLIKLDSKGEIIFKQTRVTKDGKEFKIYKFRTMIKETEGNKQITVGKDNRITKVGSFLRKTKLDELPQLFNIIKGEMSFVGPRPEVPKYVSYYTDEQKEILKVRAGITDYASIYFSNESEILGQQNDPEKYYIEEIMPYKIKLNKKYIDNMGIITDIKIIILTILKIAGVELKEEE
ncbi:sugar transferase [Fusobacterium gastrosuis]|uniref:sugar transferase n=1 Tax=Fusobacterium gastrosuis TaxID=1755100 RepID=UPI00297651C2|nr:sugar transferase [Fusobacteriaceae bacterium]MDY5712903.1 sugar transferase [Fusobacterium gastrosuis]